MELSSLSSGFSPPDLVHLSNAQRGPVIPGASDSMGAFLGRSAQSARTASQAGQAGKPEEKSAISRKFAEVAAKVASIADKLKALKIPGLAHAINLVNGVAGALEAGMNGNFEDCANQLLKAGKAALSIAKSSGKMLGKVTGRALPGVSVIIGGWGMYKSEENAEKARRKGNDGAAALWEVKGLCDAAATAMGILQILTAPTVALPAGLEAGILALSLVSEMVADAADSADGEDRSAVPSPPPSREELLRAPVDNTRVAPPRMMLPR